MSDETSWYADYLRWVGEEVANKVVVAPVELQGELLERAVRHLSASNLFNSHEMSAIVLVARKALRKVGTDAEFSRQEWVANDGALEVTRKALKERLARLLAREGIEYDE